MRYRLSRSAENDLAEIWNYTVQSWGEPQAEKYLKGLEARFLELADNPDQGKARKDLSPEYRSYHEARHVLFYSQHNDGIAIARVLHERMDLVERLEDDPGFG